MKVSLKVCFLHRQEYLFLPAKHKECYLTALLDATRGSSALVFSATCAGATRLALFNGVGVAEDTAGQAEARLDAELETPSSSLPSTAMSISLSP